ncbi:MAG: hypothetical protein RLZZ94_869 [Bacteroidota bacterium]
MRVFLFNVQENLIAGLTLLLLVIFFIIILPYLILDAIFSKPLTEEEKKKLEQERQNRYRQSLPIRCGCCAGQHRGLSSTN